MKRYTADFETCVWLENETYVWAWAVCEIGKEHNIRYGTNIEEFIELCRQECIKEQNPELYFHNLRFDGEFIISYLLTHNFKHVEKREEAETNTFTTLINEMGIFYSITIYFEKKNKHVKKVTFIDSLKIIPLPVKKISKSFNLEESKLEIDYKAFREKGHKLTDEEIAYIKNDVVIVAKALNMLFEEDLQKMTQGSNALYDYKKTHTSTRFRHLFPNLDKEIDKDIRKSYKRRFYLFKPDL